MPIWNVVRPSTYYDSVALMRLRRDVEALSGIRRAAAMMGTPANRAVLREAGLLTAEGEAAGPNDLIIAVEADQLATAHAAVAAAEATLRSASSTGTAGFDISFRPRSLRSALQIRPDANLALISVPGPYAGPEAKKALLAGLHVMLFSANVPLATEVELKRLARARGLWLLGPDCGTAILDGVPLGFANAVARGRIGLVAASGTGLQEVSCLIDAAGEGISQAIGVGGRDLSDEVGGIMALQALAALAADPATAAVGIISKPPGPSTWERLRRRLGQLGKPCVVYLAGARATPPRGAAWHVAATLEEAAHALVALARGRPQPSPFTLPPADIDRLVEATARRMHPSQRYVRGLYAGGTLAHEAATLLRTLLPDVAPHVRGEGQGHWVVDLGEDRFTVGRPHPMLDGSVRREWIVKAAQDASTAVLLLDVVLGYGVHPDPAGEILPAVQQAQRQAEAAGRHLAVVASVCGTERDPQRRGAQVEALRAHGVLVMPSNAQAARLAALIARRLAGEPTG
jgi:succinyl-CoA synthetase alpha subunit